MICRGGRQRGISYSRNEMMRCIGRASIHFAVYLRHSGLNCRSCLWVQIACRMCLPRSIPRYFASSWLSIICFASILASAVSSYTWRLIQRTGSPCIGSRLSSYIARRIEQFVLSFSEAKFTLGIFPRLTAGLG
jgi:hypothetical protein